MKSLAFILIGVTVITVGVVGAILWAIRDGGRYRRDATTLNKGEIE